MNYNNYQKDSIASRILEFAKRYKNPILMLSLGTLLLFGELKKLNLPCPYDDKTHQHYYSLERDGYRFEKGSCLEWIWGWKKLDKVTFNDAVYQYDSSRNKGLFSIEENKEELAKYEVNNQSYIQYEYQYPGADSIMYDWTNDSDRYDLTGERRRFIKFYRGIKLDSKGNIEYGPWVDSIDKIDKDYPYMDYINSFKNEYIELERTYQK